MPCNFTVECHPAGKPEPLISVISVICFDNTNGNFKVVENTLRCGLSLSPFSQRPLLDFPSSSSLLFSFASPFSSL